MTEETSAPVWVTTAIAEIIAKMPSVAARNARAMPYTTDDQGRFIDLSTKDPTWWTNGFWGGLMWQLYHVTGT